MRRRKWHFNDMVVCVLEKRIIMSPSLTNMTPTDLYEMSRGFPLTRPLLSLTADNLQTLS